MSSCILLGSYQNSGLSPIPGADLEGAQTACTPFIFCRERGPDFVWVPQAKSMHQIMQIDFENYSFSPLLRGHIPLRHPLSPQVPKFCQSLIWAPPFLKNLGSAPESWRAYAKMCWYACTVTAGLHWHHCQFEIEQTGLKKFWTSWRQNM